MERLNQAGHEVITVSAGPRFSQLAEGSYTIHPQSPQDYTLLLRTIGKFPWNILHLWNIAPYHNEETGKRIEETCLEKGFFSLLFLAQALVNTNHPEATIQIFIVSSGLHAVTGEEVLYPEQAILLGPCKVLPQEYPYISCRSIDVVLSAPGSPEWNKLIDTLLAEICHSTSDTVIAYRGPYRWVQTFEPLRFDNTREGLTKLRERGVYLITGGLGDIGLELAEYLAQQVSANLVLVGRSDFPMREEWQNSLATHGDQDVVSSKIRKLQRIETLASKLLLISTDVTEPDQVNAVAQCIRRHFGQLHGIIHTAGIAGVGLFQLKTPGQAICTLLPKVRGTRLMNKICYEFGVDFFMLCSSLTSLVGGIGTLDYCSANAYLDAFAHSNTLLRAPFTIAINWDNWIGVGMGTKRESAPARLQAEIGLSVQEGLQIFHRALQSGLPQIIVSTQPFDIVFEQERTAILQALVYLSPEFLGL